MGGRQRGNIISRSYTGPSINFYSVMVEGSPFITLQGLNLEPELKSCWCLMPLGHGRELLLVSKSEWRESQFAGGEKKKENRKKKKVLFVRQSCTIVCKCQGGKSSPKTCQAPDPAVSCSGRQKMKPGTRDGSMWCSPSHPPPSLPSQGPEHRECAMQISLLAWLT